MEETVKFAIIDIGSNSVRLMLWADGNTLYKKVCTTRLGEGLDRSGCLSPDAIGRTAEAVSRFVAVGQACGAEVYAFATAAVRSAENGKELCKAVHALCGVDVDVVSGQEEARLAVLGALGTRDGGIIDIGGASTEISLVMGEKTVFSCSLNIGAVRLHEVCGENIAQLKAHINAETGNLPSANGLFYAVGGTASTLASLKHGLKEYDPAVLQDTPLTLPWVREETNLLFSLLVEERRGLKGMDPARADILPGAALLLQTIMEKMCLDEIRFSDRDNLEGYLALKGLQ